ncbi:hypothetical protein Tco_0449166 [Tanacetum coccineum]
MCGVSLWSERGGARTLWSAALWLRSGSFRTFSLLCLASSFLLEEELLFLSSSISPLLDFCPFSFLGLLLEELLWSIFPVECLSSSDLPPLELLLGGLSVSSSLSPASYGFLLSSLLLFSSSSIMIDGRGAALMWGFFCFFLYASALFLLWPFFFLWANMILWGGVGSFCLSAEENKRLEWRSFCLSLSLRGYLCATFLQLHSSSRSVYSIKRRWMRGMSIAVGFFSSACSDYSFLFFPMSSLTPFSCYLLLL